MAAALTVHPARKRALESIPAQRQVVAEEAMDEVAAPAVVEPVVDDPDVSRPVLQVQAVREQQGAVAAVPKLAVPDCDVSRLDDLEGRPVVRFLRRHQQVVKIDVT